MLAVDMQGMQGILVSLCVWSSQSAGGGHSLSWREGPDFLEPQSSTRAHAHTLGLYIMSIK